MDTNKKPEKSRLGRGLASLIPPAAAVPPAAINNNAPARRIAPPAGGMKERIESILLSQIAPNTLQPRTDFDEESISDLAESIKAHGLLQPVMVRQISANNYELIAGERRYRASKLAGVKSIHAIVRDLTDEESLVVALIENIQRENLNSMEAARGYRLLLDQFGLTQSALAEQIGKAQSTIANSLRLLKLSPEIQETIASGQISEEHGKALLTLPDQSQRLALWQQVIKRQLSVVETRRQVQAIMENIENLGVSRRRAGSVKDVHWVAVEDKLRSALGLKVGVRPNTSGGGTLVVNFSSQDDIENILDKLKA